MQNLEPRHSLDRVEPNWKADVDIRKSRYLEPNESAFSPRQIAFIDDCLATSDPIEVVMRRFGLSSQRLAEWIVNPRFCLRIERAYRSLVIGRRCTVAGVQSSTSHRSGAVITLMRLSRDAQARERALRDPRPLDALMHELDPNKGRHQREFRRLMRKLQSR